MKITSWIKLCISGISISLTELHFPKSLKTPVTHNCQQVNNSNEPYSSETTRLSGDIPRSLNLTQIKASPCCNEKGLILATEPWETSSLWEITAPDKICFCKRLRLFSPTISEVESYCFVSLKALKFLQKQIMTTFQFLYLFYYKYMIKENQPKYCVN